jgi:hypothetical protein
MKHFLLLILMGLYTSLSADILGLDKLNRKVEEVRQLWKQADDIQNLEVSELNELRIELYGNRPNVWNMHPAQLKNLSDSVEPLREMALQLAESENKHQRYHAASLLAYLEPSETTKKALLQLAYDKGKSTAATSLSTVFGMGWDTPELRLELVRDLERIVEGEKSETIAFTNVGKWGLVEAVPAMMKILERTYFDKTIQEKGILRQFQYLGKDAAEALPLLEQILAQRKRDGDADFKELESLEYAVAAVKEGGIRQESWRDIKQEDVDRKRTPKPQNVEERSRIADSKKNEGDPRLPEEEVTEPESPNRLPLIIAGVLLVGILALLFKTFKGKSTS